MSDDTTEKSDIFELSHNCALAGIEIVDSKAILRKVNPSFIELWGYGEKEGIVGQSVTEIFSNTEKANSALREIEEGGEWEGELLAEREDGSTFHTRASASLVPTERGEPDYIISSFVDISERVSREREIKQQRDNLKILNEVVRHDIRNDLQLVTAHAEFLEDAVAEDEKEHLESVQESASNAVDLTKTARDLSEVLLRSDSEMEPVDLVSVLADQIEEARGLFPHAQITIEETVQQTSIDANKFLGSVFRNLLHNAIQHNDKDQPKVTVTVERTVNQLQVDIADNGPGIPDFQKETIFGEGEKRLESGGTGLGLYLVQSLVDSYSGDVWVEDNDPEGSLFSVQFAIAA